MSRRRVRRRGQVGGGGGGEALDIAINWIINRGCISTARGFREPATRFVAILLHAVAICIAARKVVHGLGVAKIRRAPVPVKSWSRWL